MSAYIAALKDAVAKEEASQAERKAVDTIEACANLTPLEDRLERLLSSIPVEVQSEGLSLPVLQDRLRGRWKSKCHPGELGAALRKLGFKRVRRWSGINGFEALWSR